MKKYSKYKMLTKDDIDKTLEELYGIKNRLEEEYNIAISSYNRSIFGSAAYKYYYSLVIFLGEILGYDDDKILKDIKKGEIK